MYDILFISFDVPRFEYPSIPYPLASMIASIENNGFKTSYFSIDVKQVLQDRVKTPHFQDNERLGYEAFQEKMNENNDLSTIVTNRLISNIDYFKKFKYIAMSVTRWSIEHCNLFSKTLKDNNYEGGIVFGSYEITACDDKDLEIEFPYADFYIKGYSEKAYVKLLNGEIDNRIIDEKIEDEDLISPYLSGIIPLQSRKIYWETKRGCQFRCDFCEWGALKDKNVVVQINIDRLKKEIDLIRDSNVEELNILDGTFNVGKHYFEILRYILETTNLNVTFQARFECLTDEFLSLCGKYYQRVHLEFGLQTIHQEEMQTIGRKNNLEKVKSALEKLNEKSIDYETSVIYAIPGQTMESFIDTIEFLLYNKCPKIRAYPLQLARNSKLSSEEQQKKWKIKIRTDSQTKVSSVVSSISFSAETRRDMDLLAERLITDKDLYKTHILPKNLITERQTDYLYKVLNPTECYDKKLLYRLIEEYFESPTNDDFIAIDFIASGLHRGEKLIPKKDKEDYFKRLEPNFSYNLEKVKEPHIIDFGNGVKITMRTAQHNYKFYCELRVGISGNLYVFRRIEIDG